VLYLWTMTALHSIAGRSCCSLPSAAHCACTLQHRNRREPQPYTAGVLHRLPAPGGAGLLLVPMFISFDGAIDRALALL